MSPDLDQAFWTIVIAAAASIPCALLGCFLLLRRMSMLADAVGHGVLPGIALAVLWTHELGSVMVLFGAMVFGLLTAVLAELLTRQANVSEDASLGVVFTALFAAGVVILSRFLSGTHVDLHCVSFSMLELMPLFRRSWLGVPVPEALPGMFLVMGLVMGFVALFWKELKVTTFDAPFAHTLGLPVRTVHYLLVALVASTTVSAFESFGSILVLGMFVVPAATARLITDRLAMTLALAAAFAVSACVLGYLLASPMLLSCNAGAMIVTTAGGQFALAWLLAPRYGIAAQVLRRVRLIRRMAGEEILAGLYRAEEAGAHGAPSASAEHGFSRTVVALTLFDLRRRNLLERRDEGYRLTDAGREAARPIVRGHRLWEAYLEKNFELPLDHLHAPAAQVEHYLGPELRTRLADELAAPVHDPHGRTIPPDQ